MPLAQWRLPFRFKFFSSDWLRKGPKWMRTTAMPSFTVDARPWGGAHDSAARDEREPMMPGKRQHRDLDLDLAFEDEEPAPVRRAPASSGAVAPLRVPDQVPTATSGKPRKVVHHYELCEVLGRGTYGKVKRAVDTRTGTEYALKVVKKSFLKRQRRFDESRGAYGNAYEDVLREVAILKKLSHANVVRLHEVIDDPAMDKMYLVLELVRGGPALGERRPARGIGNCGQRPVLGQRREAPLGDGPEGADEAEESSLNAGGGGEHNAAREPLSEAEARRCMADVLAGLEYLHFLGVVHRDLKPENILKDRCSGRYLICDLGVSLLADEQGCDAAVGSAGTPAYSPPEVLRREREVYSGRAADVWSLGVTLFELLTGRLPFEADGLEALAELVWTQPLPLPPPGTDGTLSEAVCDLLLQMTRKIPSERITVPQARLHSWLTANGHEPQAPALSQGCLQISISPEEVQTALLELDRSLHLVRALGHPRAALCLSALTPCSCCPLLTRSHALLALHARTCCPTRCRRRLTLPPHSG